jgi:hypothetical protein
LNFVVLEERVSLNFSIAAGDQAAKRPGASAAPAERMCEANWRVSEKLVPRGGIEPPTLRFSGRLRKFK